MMKILKEIKQIPARNLAWQWKFAIFHRIEFYTSFTVVFPDSRTSFQGRIQKIHGMNVD